MIYFFLFLFLFTHNIQAQETTPTPNNIENIQTIREVVQQKVKEKIEEITNQDQTKKKAIIGRITSISEKTLTLDSRKKIYTVTVSDETTFINNKKTKITFDKLKEGDDVLILGIVDKDTINAKRLLIINPKDIEKVHLTVVGKIADISQSSNIFTLLPTNNKDLQYQIQLDDKTEILNTKKEKLQLKDLVLGNKIIVSLRPSEKIAKTFITYKILLLNP